MKTTPSTGSNSNIKSNSKSKSKNKNKNKPPRQPTVTKTLSSICLATILSLTTTTLTPTPTYAALPLPNNDASQGLTIVTQSTLGKSVRRSVVSSAQLADTLDLKWERISDSLREKNRCDPRTNRKLFDNGVRKDGTPIGNPVLGALCTPETLRVLDPRVVGVLLAGAEDAAVGVLGVGRSELTGTEAGVERLVGASFRVKGETDGNDDEVLRRRFNKDLYVRMRSYGETISQQKENEGSKKGRDLARRLERTWGTNILTQMAPDANRKDFTSPFPKPDATDDQPYNEGALLDALGSVSVALTKMQEGGLISHWEISIPEDDDWNVVTIAVDDDISIGGQILSRERRQLLSGSAVEAIVRSAMDENAKISYAFDSFYIDPTTTKQELYNPTQLLISLSNLGL